MCMGRGDEHDEDKVAESSHRVCGRGHVCGCLRVELVTPRGSVEPRATRGPSSTATPGFRERVGTRASRRATPPCSESSGWHRGGHGGIPVEAWNASLGEPLAYVGDENGYMNAVNANTGAIVWSVPFGSAFTSTPLVSGSSVWVAPLASGRIYKLDAATGAIQCAIKEVGSIQGSPVVATLPGGQTLVYFPTLDTGGRGRQHLCHQYVFVCDGIRLERQRGLFGARRHLEPDQLRR